VSDRFPLFHQHLIFPYPYTMILIHFTTITSGFLNRDSRFWNVPCSVYVPECLLYAVSDDCHRQLSLNYCRPTRSRWYLSSTFLDHFRASQRFHRTIQYAKKKSSPLFGKFHLRRPTDFMGLSTWNGLRVRAWYCPPLIIATPPLMLSALLCQRQ